MANQKITALTETTTLAANDVFAVVTDTAGTPATKKVKVSSMMAEFQETDVLAAWGAGTSVPASTTYYTAPFKPAPDATANNVPWPEGGTLEKMNVRISLTQPASGSLVVTLYKNDSATSLSVTIPAGTTGGTHSDLVNTVSFSAGDLLRWTIVNNATAGSANLTVITMVNRKPTA